MNAIIANYFREKYRNSVTLTGYWRTAKNMRKQGIELRIALLILLNAVERES